MNWFKNRFADSYESNSISLTKSPAHHLLFLFLFFIKINIKISFLKVIYEGISCI